MEIFIGKSVPVNGHIPECDAYRLNKINISLYSAASPSFLPTAPPKKKTKEKKTSLGVMGSDHSKTNTNDFQMSETKAMPL